MRSSSSLSTPSLLCLKYVAERGPCSTAELITFQRLQPGGVDRAKAAVNGTAYNLYMQGYLQRAAQGSSLWELTELGRYAAAQCAAVAIPPVPAAASARPAARDAAPPSGERSQPVRAVRYGGGFINLPVAPRWVFELGCQP